MLKIVRLNKIWVEGYVKTAEFARHELKDCDATVDIEIKPRQPLQFQGKVIFVNPTSPTGDSFQVRVEVENRKVGDSWILSPGLPATMTIQTKPANIGN